MKSTLLVFTVLMFLVSGCGKSGKGKIEHQDHGKQPWVVDIDKLTIDNENFRTTWWTGERLQMTTMTIKPGGEIGLEAHPNSDQFLRLEKGKAKVYMGRTKDDLSYVQDVSDDWAVFIPAGYWHNMVNTGSEDVKLYSIYSPVEHPKGTVHEKPEDDPHHDSDLH